MPQGMVQLDDGTWAPVGADGSRYIICYKIIGTSRSI